MAAGQVVCSFFPVVFERLNGLIKEDHLGSFWGVEEELDDVFIDFCMIKGVLTDAEQKQFIDGEEAVRFWLKKLNAAAYEADDVLDELQVKALQLASEEMGSPEEMIFRQNIQEDIKKLSKMFRKIAKTIRELYLQKGNVEKRMEEICPGREPTSPIAMEPHPYGRVEDKEELLERLLRDDYKSLNRSSIRHPSAPTGRPLRCSAIEDITICCIVGIGGIGKTTLAQMVYNDAWVAKHFTSRFWVCVSNDFDAERIVNKIVVSSDFKKLEEQIAGASGKLASSDSFEKLEDGLKKLSGTRFLLVLDDVWEENQEKWNKFKAFFRAGVGEGSSIIVTTRLQTVANITSTVPPLCIKGLSKEDCLHLFKKYAFGFGNKKRSVLVKIGEEIVDKCGGLPLAVKALASLLRHKKEENEWLSIKDSAIWELRPSDVNNILPALMSSYSHLPPLLKQCFVYCSIFPQNCEIDKDDLIQQWMAHSLVQPEAGKELEDVGNEIFNALLWRSFFQDAGKDEYGDIISYKMHDLIHDLASYIAGDEYFVGGEERSRKFCKITRHVSLPNDLTISRRSSLEPIERASPYLRSLIIWPKKIWLPGNSEFLFPHFRRLRALDLGHSKLIPDCFDEMIHLRYINLSHTDIKFLPKSICLLRNLQTLKLQWCWKLKALPNDMTKMSSLRHLDIRRCDRLKSMPVGFGELSSLRGLNCFILSSKSGYGMSWLHKLNPGAELEIKGLEHVISSTEAKAANLVEKKKIRSLSLEWSLTEKDSQQQQQQHQSQNATEDEDSQQQQQHQEVIDGLQPHAKLRELFVKGYQGPNSPSWLIPSCVPNLVKISLSKCRRCKRLSPLGKLGSLKVLELHHMDSLKFIVMDDARTFPSLEELRLCDMPDLEGWSSSSLQQSTLSSSSQETIAPVFPCLKEVLFSRCPKLKGEVPLSRSPVEIVSIDKSSSNGMVLGSLHDLHHLPSLEIYGYDETENLPAGALRNLTALQKLTISNWDNLKTLPVQLKSLTTLRELAINVCRNLVSLAEGEGGLRNLSSLRTLKIYECDALKRLPELDKTSLVYMRINRCPQLEFSTQDFEELVSLKRLELVGFPKLTCFPKGGLRNLSSLKTLHIDGCNALKHLPQFHETSLVDLAISNCPQMEFSTNDFQHLDVLERLKLSRLPKLTCFPKGELRNLSSPKTLHIDDCNALKHLPQFYKTSLVDLAISNCPQMEFSTDDFEHLVVLEQLKLSRLPKLTCFPKGGLRNLSSLKTLHIDDCNTLKHLPQFHKTSLVDLAINNCPQMEFSTDDFEHLVVLKVLKLLRLPKLTFFPEGIKHTAAKLQILIFKPCSENGAIDLPDWISSLISLQVLSISVPKNWKVLPQWLQHVTALEILYIYGCDEELERRWKNKDEQRDDNCFNMISHVSLVRISSNDGFDGY